MDVKESSGPTRQRRGTLPKYDTESLMHILNLSSYLGRDGEGPESYYNNYGIAKSLHLRDRNWSE